MTERIIHTDEKGRKYNAYKAGDDVIIIGPPEDLVDTLELPEPYATKLHNELHRRGLISYDIATKQPQQLFAALQSVLNVDVQRLLEALRCDN